MFACPHCQFENPIQNRFCQRCGNALRGLRAIVTPASGSTAVGQLPETASTELEGSASQLTESKVATESRPEPLTVAHLLTDKHYLQGEQRYQLRHPEVAQQPISAEIVLDVLDTTPAADSPIVQWLDEGVEPAVTEAMINQLPPSAIPYWKLQEQFFPIIPELQAAWQENNHTILVVEDRSAWKSLPDIAASSEVEALELLHWFYEAVHLWSTLSNFKAEASLLELDNLRVDDDQILCIQRLIYNDQAIALTLQDLGLFWQSLIQQFADHTVPAFENLVADIAAGIVSTPYAVEEILADIADNLQLEQPDSETTQFDGEEISQPLDSETSDNNDGHLDAIALDDLLNTENLPFFEETEDDDIDFSDDQIGDLPTMALPMKLNRLEEVGRTHVGRQRNHNEDFFFAETQLQRSNSPLGSNLTAKGMYILCDGMGGHSGGEVASALAVSTLRDYFAECWDTDLPDEAMVKEAILKANQVIFDKNEAEERTGNARMGTTLVMVLIADDQAIVAHVGDSRLYTLTRQGFHQVTTDHEVGQREISRGVEPAIAYARPDAYQLTQALGPRKNEEVVPTVNSMDISQDTLFLLCSDGLSDNDLLETHVETYIEPMLRTRHDLEEGVANLIDLANEHNGHDNITAIAVRIKMRPNLEAAKSSITAPSNQSVD